MQSSFWLKHCDCRLDPCRGRCGLHRLIEQPLGLAPGPPRLRCDASFIAATLCALLHFVVGLSSGLDLMLDLLPLTVHDTLEFTLGMKHVEPHLDRYRWGVLLPLPRIGDDTLHTGPVPQYLTPAFPRAIWPALPRNPRHTAQRY